MPSATVYCTRTLPDASFGCPATQLPLYRPFCRQMCIVFSAERRIRLSFSHRFGHVSSCCRRCLINLKLYECCRGANVASIFQQFIRRTRSLSRSYHSLSVCLPLESQNVQKVLAQNERISQKPKWNRASQRAAWRMRIGQVCQPNYFSLSQI